MGSSLHESQLPAYARHIATWLASHHGAAAFLVPLVPAGSTSAALLEAQRALGPIAAKALALSWQDVGLELAGVANECGEARLGVYLEDFNALIRLRLGDGARPFTSEEERLFADPLVPRAVLAARSIVTLTVEKLKAERPQLTARTSTGMGFDGYGIYAGDRWWWVGTWVDVWQVASTPIVLQLPGLWEDVAAAGRCPSGLPYSGRVSCADK